MIVAMGCDAHRIYCQLQRIANSLDGVDWASTFATLISTFLGAALAGGVAVWVMRREQRERYSSRLIEAVEASSTAISIYAADYKTWMQALPKWFALSDEEREKKPRPQEPDTTTFDIMLDMLIARAEGDDREIAVKIRAIAYQLIFIQDSEWVSFEYGTLRRVMAAWVSRRRTLEETKTALGTIWRRHELKHANESIAESALPEAPEQYERPAF